MKCFNDSVLTPPLKNRCSLLLRMLSPVLLALILNLNGLRVMTGRITFLSYLLFVLFGLVVFATYLIEKRSWPAVNLPLAATAALAFVWAAASVFLKGGGDGFGLGNLLKFAASLAVAFLAAQLDERQRVRTMQLTLGIGVFYALYATVEYPFIFPNYVVPKIFNYLDVTLPMGLSLAISLTLLLMGGESRREIALYFGAACMQMLGLLQYSARGNLLFPLLVVLLLLGVMAVVDRRQRLRNLALIGIIIVAAAGFILLFANSRLLRRLTSLISSPGEEKRLALFCHYCHSIATPKTLLLGLGFGQSRGILLAGGFEYSYPHNFALELVGELGLAGIALLVTSLVVMIRSVRIHLRKISQRQEGSLFLKSFLFSSAGFLYYLMNFSKSYSIFDGYQLFIFVALLAVVDPKPGTLCVKNDKG
jgi:hypothetical protein